jgi:hypothetical protein
MSASFDLSITLEIRTKLQLTDMTRDNSFSNASIMLNVNDTGEQHGHFYFLGPKYRRFKTLFHFFTSSKLFVLLLAGGDLQS